MTKYDEAWVAEEQAKRAFLAEKGMYAPDTEHDNCGVGLVVSIDGKPSRQVVQAGITALKAIWHRGAVDADGKTGDGAGIHVQIPKAFFEEQVRRTGHTPRGEKLAVGQIFLPRNDFGAQEPGSEAEIADFCQRNYGVRFPMFEKVEVNREGRHPLYRELVQAQPQARQLDGSQFADKLAQHGLTPKNPSDVMWNFEKFLVDREGKVIARFAPDVKPDDPALVAAIEAALG